MNLFETFLQNHHVRTHFLFLWTPESPPTRELAVGVRTKPKLELVLSCPPRAVYESYWARDRARVSVPWFCFGDLACYFWCNFSKFSSNSSCFEDCMNLFHSFSILTISLAFSSRFGALYFMNNSNSSSNPKTGAQIVLNPSESKHAESTCPRAVLSDFACSCARHEHGGTRAVTSISTYANN